MWAPTEGANGANIRVRTGDPSVTAAADSSLYTREPCPAGDGRTHRSAPTRGGEMFGNQRKSGAKRKSRQAGQSPPPAGASQVVPAGRPSGASAPTGATQVVPSNGPWSSASTDRRGRFSNHPGQRRTAKRLRQRSRGNGRESEQRSSPKCPATPDNPSVARWATAPFAQGSLRGRGHDGKSPAWEAGLWGVHSV